MEHGSIVKKSHFAILMAILVTIWLLLSDSACSLHEVLNNDSSSLPPDNQQNLELAVQDTADTPSPAKNKQETLPTNNGPGNQKNITQAIQRHEQKPLTAHSMKVDQVTLQVAQASNSEHLQRTRSKSENLAANPEVVDQEDRPLIPPAKAREAVAETTTQKTVLHQGESGVKAGGVFGEIFKEPISGMEFVLVKGGCYQMGSDLRALEGPVHEVCVDDFYLSKHEVTQEQWKTLMYRNYSYFKGRTRPVERVTWDDCQRFIGQLNSRSDVIFRLPTEAEWEYAARDGGRDERYAGTSDEVSLTDFAWHQVNSNRQTHMVGMKKPNRLGLHDMSGNVWEWCSDWYDISYYANSQRNNPRGPSNGIHRVIRGGEWELPAGLARSTYREAAKPGSRRSDIGFRLALTLPK